MRRNASESSISAFATAKSIDFNLISLLFLLVLFCLIRDVMQIRGIALCSGQIDGIQCMPDQSEQPLALRHMQPRAGRVTRARKLLNLFDTYRKRLHGSAISKLLKANKYFSSVYHAPISRIHRSNCTTDISPKLPLLYIYEVQYSSKFSMLSLTCAGHAPIASRD